MRQVIWDISGGTTTLDWPDEEGLPNQACLQIGYHQEIVVENGPVSLALFQWPQTATDEHPRPGNKPRYLLLLTMSVGYEIIGARDLKGLLHALRELAPLTGVMQTPLTSSVKTRKS